MTKSTNIGLIAEGELFGFPAQFAIAKVNGELQVVGTLNTQGKKPENLLQQKELNLSNLTGKLTILPKSADNFSVDFVKRADTYAFLLTSGGIVCGIVLAGESKQLVLALNTNQLKNGNEFERFVAGAAEWAKISDLSLVVQNKQGGTGYALLKKLAGTSIKLVEAPKEYQQYQLIAAGIFDLNKTGFGKSVQALTGLNQLQFAVGAGFADKSFGATLVSSKIEKSGFTIENLSFGLQKSAKDFSCIASGTFIFKLENNPISFKLSGAVSNTSFTLSAASLPNMKIPLNSRLAFSDLGLSIGISSGKPSFGMVGRLSTPNLSIFAGFAMSPPRITLLSAAITSTTGRISLKDLVVEIADIQWDAVNCLDVIAVGDFDLPNTSLSKKVEGFPTRPNDENYELEKDKLEKAVAADFNTKMNEALQIKGKAQLTPIGTNTNQYVLTDKSSMRHYRIDAAGKISLNCQVYICTEPDPLGKSTPLPMGFFMCGTLEIFNVKARFLFSVDKGKSLVALVQIKEINISGIFVLTKSGKALPMQPINGGLAGQLVQSTGTGAVMYLNIQKNKGELTFYLSAKIKLLSFFEFDSLVLIKDKLVYVDIQYTVAGFKVALSLVGGYKDFSTAGFKATVIFDTSGFLEILQKVQNAVKDAAKSIKMGIENANRKLSEAQQRVMELKRQIEYFDNRIRQCKWDISHSRWYQVWIKVARAAEIVGLRIAQGGVYVAIGVAYSALEIAKAAVTFSGKVAEGVLLSVAYVLQAVTQLFWIKSFELGITAKPDLQLIQAKLTLIICGKEISLNGQIQLTGIIDSIKSFITNQLTGKSNELITDIKSGKPVRALSNTFETDHDFFAPYSNLAKNNSSYAELVQARDAVEDLFLDANDAYFDAFNEENTAAREAACRLTTLRWEEEIFRNQFSDALDSEFESSLHTLREHMETEQLTRNEAPLESVQRIDELLNFVQTLNSENRFTTRNTQERESLFDRVERKADNNRNAQRVRTATLEQTAREANEQYVQRLSALMEQHLGDKTDEASQEFRETITLALDELRNANETSQ